MKYSENKCMNIFIEEEKSDVIVGTDYFVVNDESYEKLFSQVFTIRVITDQSMQKSLEISGVGVNGENLAVRFFIDNSTKEETEEGNGDEEE